jgi:hypothetical protein
MFFKLKENKIRIILISFMIGIFAFSFAKKSFAWYKENHQRMTKAAINLLTEKEKAFLGFAADSLIDKYCMFPDWYRNAVRDGRKKEAKLYEKYVNLPLLQDLKKWHKNNDDDSEICYYIIATLMSKAIYQLQAGNKLEAVKYMGPLVHFIEDNASPVHVIDNKLLAQLLPKPDDVESFPFHRTAEEPTFAIVIPDYKPVLLGSNIDDSAITACPRFREIRILSRATSIDVIKGIYEGNREKADQARARAAIPAVKLVTDLIHTICTQANTSN